MRSTDFADFYQRESHALVRFAATIVGPDRADDVVANAVVSVMGRVMDNPSARVPQTEAQLRPYLYKAVVNAGAKEWRTISRRTRRHALIAIRDRERIEPTDNIGPGLHHEAIAIALADLSPRQRAVIHLAYWEDLTVPTIAGRLDLSEGSVRRHLARGRAALRSVLASEVGHQPTHPEADPMFGGSQ